MRKGFAAVMLSSALVLAAGSSIMPVYAKMQSAENRQAVSEKTETEEKSADMTQKQTKEKNAEGFVSITMEEAKEIFEKEGDDLILDVRHADEYAQGHIPGAINIANEDIRDRGPEILTDKEQVIYVYCRSGRRSRQAAASLAALGYVNVIECGGILDWTGEVE